MIRPRAPLRVVTPEASVGPASPSTPCQTCGARTADGKPYCDLHVADMPYVRRLAHLRAARGEEVEVPSRRDRDEVLESAKRLNGAARVKVKESPKPRTTVKPGTNARGHVFPPKPCLACTTLFAPTNGRQRYCKGCGAPSKRAVRSRKGRLIPAASPPAPPPAPAPRLAPVAPPPPPPPPPPRVQVQAPGQPPLELMRGTHDLLAVLARVARAVADELGRMAAETRPR